MDELAGLAIRRANRLLLKFSRNGDAKKLRRVLKEGKANIETPGGPLAPAARRYYGDGDCHTGLTYASMNGHVECVKLLLAANANVRTGLLLASRYGHVECVKLLLATNANVNMSDRVGNTGLLLAVLNNRVECLKLLLEADADVNAQALDKTGLIWASKLGRAECLLAANATVDTHNRFGEIGLILASRYGRVECLKFLLAANANVNAHNRFGGTGLILASMYSRVECLKLLLAANADVNAQDQSGNTGLIYASANGHVECLKLLLAANADVNAQDQNGDTGLIYASRYGHVYCLMTLLENNANVNHQNESKETAWTCVDSDYQDLIQFLLRSCGAEGEEGEEILAEMNTRITEYHTELMDVLSEEVVVDTRLYLEEHGLYHEPLERVMQYCGLELMLENDPNRNEADMIPVLLRGRKQRVHSVWYWWQLLLEMDG